MNKNTAVTQARCQRGWGVVRLSREAGCTPATIYSTERGVRTPQIATRYRIAAALDRPMDDLFPDAD